MKNLILFILIVAISTLSVACVITGIKGSGKTHTEQRDVESFKSIDVSSGITLYLYQDGKNELMVEADSNLVEYIETVVKHDILYVRVKKNIVKAKTLNVHVHCADIEDLTASGGSDIIGKTILKTSKLELNGSGGSDMKLDVDVNDIEISISGGADIEIAGSANKLNLDASGGSDIKACELKVNEGVVNASGGSDVEVFASKALEINASGAADVVFDGKPKDINIDKSGGSDVKRKK